MQQTDRRFIKQLRDFSLIIMCAGAIIAAMGFLPDNGPVWPPIILGGCAVAVGTVIVSIMAAILID